MADCKQWGRALFTVKSEGSPPSSVAVSGRDRWALECLIAAGERGCTPIDTPGPRWSGYVHNLRNLGVPIRTVTEAHEGPFAGTHARYVLCAPVERVEGATA
ncbi:winged helix domain-containing protein [Sulfitobacter sp. EhC04]|uniref:winged helix domain-containing protein n=1 Tax=Sulfitobacter sp. EhC04 TaxID=1849168 RepID=UPI0009EEA02A